MQLQILLSHANLAPFGFDCGISTKTDPDVCPPDRVGPTPHTQNVTHRVEWRLRILRRHVSAARF